MGDILIDKNSREIFNYSNSNFPLEIWIDDYTTMTNNILQYHWHNDFEFCLLLSGEIDFYIDKNKIPIRKGEGVFINAGSLHMGKLTSRGDSALMLVITFHPSLFLIKDNHSFYKKYIQNIIESKIIGGKINSNSVIGAILIDRLKKLYMEHCDKQIDELLLLSSLFEIWHYFLKYIDTNQVIEKILSHKQEREIKDIIFFIQTHYSENIVIDDIAKYAKISRSECFRIFKKFTSKKPIEYINNYRLASAARMIKNSNLTITDIYIKCGFSNASYFGKLFKKKYGLTPLKFRKHFNNLNAK
ncbi:AraC family transcriptional regulator [Lactococcus lactis]|uniref:AraC family transcriptional regulator n=1 Tax=Lactococcus lactis TaxID=1358 RepID=UPI0024186B57|nr:AraC family transcriptional regulator [Lactococcus lactis]MDG4990273.1 AraC family transcriptional regulator [Lactococcus lactis]